MCVEHTIINLQNKNIFGTNIIFGTNLAPTRWHQLFTLPILNSASPIGDSMNNVMYNTNVERVSANIARDRRAILNASNDTCRIPM